MKGDILSYHMRFKRLISIHRLHRKIYFCLLSFFSLVLQLQVWLLNQVEDILATSLASLVPLTPVELYNSVNALANVEVPLQWGEFLMRFSSLSGFLVRRADDTLMFFHPTFREWLVRRKDFESKKFLCDPRNGHAAIAFRYMTERLTLNLPKS